MLVNVPDTASECSLANALDYPLHRTLCLAQFPLAGRKQGQWCYSVTASPRAPPLLLLLLRINTACRRTPEFCFLFLFFEILGTFQLETSVALPASGFCVLVNSLLSRPPLSRRHAWSWSDTSRVSPTSRPLTSSLKVRRTCGAS